MTSILNVPRATYADYLSVESMSDHRYEFIDGAIVAMAGSSPEKSAIGASLTSALDARCGGSCFTYACGLRFWIEATSRARYSDGAVICGPPLHASHDRNAITNPTIVVEISSPEVDVSGDDNGEKRRDFQSLPSLQAYVVAAQHRRRIYVHRRAADAWHVYTYGDGHIFDLPGLRHPVLVVEIYDGIVDGDGRSLLRVRP